MFKYKVHFDDKFLKDLKKIKKRHYDLSKLEEVINLLASGEELPAKYFDHAMVNMNGIRNCHIKKNWVLFYLKDDVSLILLCLRTGTHDDLGI